MGSQRRQFAVKDTGVHCSPKGRYSSQKKYILHRIGGQKRQTLSSAGDSVAEGHIGEGVLLNFSLFFS